MKITFIFGEWQTHKVERKERCQSHIKREYDAKSVDGKRIRSPAPTPL